MPKEFDKLMHRIKNLKEFEVQMQIPEDFVFSGMVPFDMSISNDIAFVKVVAVSMEEAVDKVRMFFDRKEDEDFS